MEGALLWLGGGGASLRARWHTLKAARVQRNTPVRLISMTDCHCSSFMRIRSPSLVIPALFTTTCERKTKLIPNNLLEVTDLAWASCDACCSAYIDGTKLFDCLGEHCIHFSLVPHIRLWKTNVRVKGHQRHLHKVKNTLTAMASAPIALISATTSSAGPGDEA